MQSVDVRQVGTDEQDRAVAVQVMAFGADPVMRWAWPEPRDYLECFPRFLRAFGGTAFAESTAYTSEGFGGVSMWLPPGAEPDADAIVEVFESTLEQPRLDESFAIFEQMGAHHIEEPHWYLAVIGVDPASQGKGVGSALLRHTLAECDAHGLPAYLESSNPANVPLYERHGFEVVGEIQAGSSPVIYPMLRRAR